MYTVWMLCDCGQASCCDWGPKPESREIHVAFRCVAVSKYQFADVRIKKFRWTYSFTTFFWGGTHEATKNRWLTTLYHRKLYSKPMYYGTSYRPHLFCVWAAGKPYQILSCIDGSFAITKPWLCLLIHSNISVYLTESPSLLPRSASLNFSHVSLGQHSCLVWYIWCRTFWRRQPDSILSSTKVRRICTYGHRLALLSLFPLSSSCFTLCLWSSSGISRSTSEIDDMGEKADYERE